MRLEEAVHRAREFLRVSAGYFFTALERARLEGGVWVLEFNVSAVGLRLVRVRLDDKTGKVVGYESMG